MSRHVLVDGSNVALCSIWRTAHGGADRLLLQQRLVDAVASWAAASGVQVALTFDGAGPFGVGERSIGGCMLVVATGATTADQWIEARVGELAAQLAVIWVVTSDGAVRAATGAGVELHVRADDFAREVLSVAGWEGLDERAAALDAPPAGGLGAHVDETTREQLERMRRGE